MPPVDRPMRLGRVHRVHPTERELLPRAVVEDPDMRVRLQDEMTAGASELPVRMLGQRPSREQDHELGVQPRAREAVTEERLVERDGVVGRGRMVGVAGPGLVDERAAYLDEAVALLRGDGEGKGLIHK